MSRKKAKKALEEGKIDVNITIDEMLDTAWELFGKYFSKAETGIKQALIDKYWKD